MCGASRPIMMPDVRNATAGRRTRIAGSSAARGLVATLAVGPRAVRTQGFGPTLAVGPCGAGRRADVSPLGAAAVMAATMQRSAEEVRHGADGHEGVHLLLRDRRPRRLVPRHQPLQHLQNPKR